MSEGQNACLTTTLHLPNPDAEPGIAPHENTDLHTKIREKISTVKVETLTGSPGRPLGPTSPSSPWNDREKRPDGKMLLVNSNLGFARNHFKICIC